MFDYFKYLSDGFYGVFVLLAIIMKWRTDYVEQPVVIIMGK